MTSQQELQRQAVTIGAAVAASKVPLPPLSQRLTSVTRAQLSICTSAIFCHDACRRISVPGLHHRKSILQ